MKVWVLRHGEAQSRARSDAERELTAHGREEVLKSAVHLSDKSVQRIIASPYVRALQTAELVRQSLGFNDPVVTVPWLTPDSSPREVLLQLDKLGVDEVLLCYPGILAVIHHRLAHHLYRAGLPLLARISSEIAHSATGIDIHPGAQIGPSFFIDHGTGVVIGETAIIGERVRIYQAVTLGAKRFPSDEDGQLQKGHARHPIVEDDVVI
ncbi:Serine O-acetyltransferase [Pseudomonas amygdali pv. photiniae]|uniref:Serine O-acetyltransferase n=2 Tax=Pseudomonas syringae group TaxID=136849 RepID=A0A658K3F8_PSEA0|nr:Serine O-acetyltransferase [Pseudomonas amygdali pv. photiniae]